MFVRHVIAHEFRKSSSLKCVLGVGGVISDFFFEGLSLSLFVHHSNILIWAKIIPNIFSDSIVGLYV